jgi:ribosome-associated protein
LEHFELNRDFIKLDALLKVIGICDTGGQAKLLIREGLVSVNGQATTQRGRKIRAGDRVQVSGPEAVTISVRAG